MTLIGDSTAVGLDAAGIADSLAFVGVSDARLEVSGGRSMVERLEGQENAVEVAQRVAGSGFNGCWVIVLGANDAANIAAGANTDAATRVSRMIDAIGGQPTLWLGASTVTTSGFWARPNITAWNSQLRGLLSDVGNAALADWDAVVGGQPWFVSDGIHPNTDGSIAMASFIAASLLYVYPQR